MEDPRQVDETAPHDERPLVLVEREADLKRGLAASRIAAEEKNVRFAAVGLSLRAGRRHEHHAPGFPGYQILRFLPRGVGQTLQRAQKFAYQIRHYTRNALVCTQSMSTSTDAAACEYATTTGASTTPGATAAGSKTLPTSSLLT